MQHLVLKRSVTGYQMLTFSLVAFNEWPRETLREIAGATKAVPVPVRRQVIAITFIMVVLRFSRMKITFMLDVFKC